MLEKSAALDLPIVNGLIPVDLIASLSPTAVHAASISPQKSLQLTIRQISAIFPWKPN